jgi:peptide/nickel transport system substrate-binding protein
MGEDVLRLRCGRHVMLEFLYSTLSPISRNMAEILRDRYAKVGVELLLRPMDWAAFSQRFAAGEFDAAPNGDTPIPPSIDPYFLFHSSQVPPNGQNTGFYRNSEVDRAIEAAQREMNDSRRLELVRHVHRLLAADQPADFWWEADQYWGISKHLEGVETSPLGLFHFLPGPLAWRPISN